MSPSSSNLSILAPVRLITMKYFLSSYKFGNHKTQLKHMVPANPNIGCINNSRDWVGADPARAARHQQEEMHTLAELGFVPEALDLTAYFGKKEALAEKLADLGAVWVSGGNTFVLRQAMYLSGFDGLVKVLQAREDFLWAGYSAGICILSDSLKSIDQVDDPYNFPYEGLQTPIYEGLGVFPYAFFPHYDSDHPESADVDKEVKRAIEQKWLFKVLRDDEVIIME